MSDVSPEVQAQADLVRELKAKKAPKPEVDEAVAKLLELKKKAGIDPAAGSNNKKATSEAKPAESKPAENKAPKEAKAKEAKAEKAEEKTKAEKPEAKPKAEKPEPKPKAEKAEAKPDAKEAKARKASAKQDAEPVQVHVKSESKVPADVLAQAEIVKKLKADKAPKEEVEAAVKELLRLKEAAGIDPNAGSNSKKEKAVGSVAVVLSKGEIPENIRYRVECWDRAAEARKLDSKPSLAPIEIKFEGKVVMGKSGETTPQNVSKDPEAIVAKVDGKYWDIHRPLIDNCALEVFKFDTPEGKHAFWHSSSHVLGQSMELTFKNAQLCMGPPLDEGGFYYDVFLGDDKITPEHFGRMEKLIGKVSSEKQPFIRLELKKEEALEMFRENRFKQEIIKSKIPDGGTCSAYRCGPLIDLCKGPHIPNTGLIKAMCITSNSSSYWLAKAENASLQRVYGISFPDEKQLADYQERMRWAEERDHRKVGVAQKLFFFHELSPGSAFFLPHGARVYNTLQNFIRAQYRKRGYEEVISPNVYNIDLWKTSGHYTNYKDNMFLFDIEGQQFGMKPMNCPGHCVMFRSFLHSYKELPIRYADFGVLHRNELSGALTGLTRVRRFQQDDAHIFARHDQIESEVAGVLDMLHETYGILGFTFELMLSTRPEKFLGELEVWDKAEMALAQALNKFGQSWTINHGDGAFYGPKIDIQVLDALKRRHQCATIQLDFQLPIRFGLSYKAEGEGFETPVIIHRAILGSVERMFAILMEHTGGKWPFWLSPRQIMIITIAEKYMPYAREVRSLLHDQGYFVDVEETNRQLAKKVREAQLAQYNLILVIGEEERENRSVNVRLRDSPDDKHVWSLAELLRQCKNFTDFHL